MTDYEDAIDAIIRSDLERLKFLADQHDDFPQGKDSLVQRDWIRNAVDCGTIDVVRWMLDEGVAVNFDDDEGYAVLHCAIDRDERDKYRILELLCEAGADVNARGLNDWTPLHMAAARNDVEALRILLRFGADTKAKTRIDACATPLEEAKALRSSEAINFLEEFEQTGKL